MMSMAVIPMLIILCVQHVEEILVLQKRINQIQTDLATTQTQVQDASDKLEETNKQLAAVSNFPYLTYTVSTKKLHP